jgi:hypothetical protein
MKQILLLITLIYSGILNAQQISTDPAFPTPENPVTVTFNATGTPLEGYTGDVYAHTGVTIEGLGQWQHVIGNWGVNTEQPKLTRIATNVYQLVITPSINDFYPVSSGEKVTEFCFVFRASTGSPQSADLFVNVYEFTLSVTIITPETNLLIPLNTAFEIKAASNLADSLILYFDNTRIDATDQAELTFNWVVETKGKHWIKAEAKDATSSVFDSVYYYVIDSSVIAELPAGIKEGINYLDDNTVTLALYAPNKEFVYLQGDFNDWDFTQSLSTSITSTMAAQVSTTTTYQMNKTASGEYYWITLNNLETGKEYRYQYLVDGSINIADPYSEKILDPWNDKYISGTTYPNLIPYPDGKATYPVSVFQTNQAAYEWEVTNFTPPAVTDMVVYELLVRDFLATHDFKTLIDTLNYIKNLGVNVIELMPVSEFEGNNSWGYNPSFYFAVDKYYGPATDFKKFIDVCHKNGIAVVMDMVLNHSFGLSPMVRMYWDETNNRPSADNPWFNPVAKHDYNVGYDMNHESLQTKKFSSRVMKFWLEEYHIDGYRFDLSKGFTQKNTLGNVGAWGPYDATRIAIWKQYADSIWSAKDNAYIILEHFADNTEEKELSNYGMLIWGNMNGKYCEGAMGWNESGKSDLSWISYKSRGWNDAHVIGYMESHDEERMMYRNLQYGNANGDYSVKNLNTGLSRVELAANFFFTIPGPKMIWQFGELGYDYSIDFNGRVGEKPVRWDYWDNAYRRRVYDIFSSLGKLKTVEPAFETTDYSLNVGGAVKTIHLNHSDMNVVVLGNFDLVSKSVNPDFQNTGTWYNYYTSEPKDITNTQDLITLAPGEYRIYTTKQLEKPIVGIDEYFNEAVVYGDLKVYPNPVDQVLYILDADNLASVTVLNIFGQEVYTDETSGAMNQLSVQSLKSGIYVVIATDHQGIKKTARFIKN